MKRVLLIAMMIALYCQNVKGQGQFAIDFSLPERANRVERAFDGGLIVAGTQYTSNSSNSAPNQVFLARMDSQNNLLWNLTFGDPNFRNQSPVITLTDDNNDGVQDDGILLAFGTNSFSQISSSAELAVVKVDFNGALQWFKLYGTITGSEKPGDIITLADNQGFAIAGQVSESGNNLGFVMEMNSSGVLQWASTYSFRGDDILTSIIQTDDDGDREFDDGFLVGGYARGSNVSQGTFPTATKLTPAGNITWSKEFVEDGGIHFGLILGLFQHDDQFFFGGSEVIGVGSQSENVGTFFRTNLSGSLQISKHIIAGPSSALDNIDIRGFLGVSAEVTGTPSLVTFGKGNDGSNLLNNGCMLNLDLNGNILDQMIFGGSGQDIFYGASADGAGFVAVGETQSFNLPGWNAYVVRADNNFNSGCSEAPFFAVANTEEYSLENLGIKAAYSPLEVTLPMVSISALVSLHNLCIVGAEESNKDISVLRLYPSPLHDELNIELNSEKLSLKKLELWNTRGQLAAKFDLSGKVTQLRLPTMNPGIYFAKIETSDGAIDTHKVIVMK